MGSKQWFLIKYINGRPELYSGMFNSYEEAKIIYDKDSIGVLICETIYG